MSGFEQATLRKDHYLKQGFGALKGVQKNAAMTGRRILPLLLYTTHWHGFFISWRSTSLHNPMQMFSIPAYGAGVQASLHLAACASAHTVSC